LRVPVQCMSFCYTLWITYCTASLTSFFFLCLLFSRHLFCSFAIIPHLKY
jgi:hypothetical protein